MQSTDSEVAPSAGPAECPIDPLPQSGGDSSLWAELAGVRKDALIMTFEELLGRPAPPYIRRRLLELAIGYALQEKAGCGPDPELMRQLRRLEKRLSETGELGIQQKRTIKPGTRLLRDWQGKTHVVTVTATGFLYGSVQYRSLSAIAREITGTYWSGPKFFGLKGDR